MGQDYEKVVAYLLSFTISVSSSSFELPLKLCFSLSVHIYVCLVVHLLRCFRGILGVWLHGLEHSGYELLKRLLCIHTHTMTC